MRHTVEIVERSKRDYEYPSIGTVAIANLIVKPPVTVGDKFSDVLIGQEASTHIKVEEVVSTNESTTLIIEANGVELQRGNDMLDTVAGRVDRLVNNPEQALAMMQEEPFSDGNYYT